MFHEVYLWTSGRVQYLKEESEIRQIAKQVFHQAFVMHSMHVCNEIFYVIACEHMGVER